MKKLILIAISLIISTSFCGKNTGKESPESLKATISYYSGSVQLERAGQRQKAEIGVALKASDVIITAEESAVDVMIAGVGIVKIGSDSRAEVIGLMSADRRSSTEWKLHRGEMGSFVNRADSSSTYSVITPTAIAGVRGTAFLTSVERLPEGSANAPQVKVAVLSGSVAVNLPGQEEVIVTSNSQVVLNGFQRISRDMVQPLSPESLRAIKNLAVFHKGNVLEFNTLVDEIRSTSPELQAMEGSVEASSRDMSRRERGSQDVIGHAARTDVSRHVQRDTEGDPIKLSPNRSYEQ